MTIFQYISLLLMAALYIFAGIAHFRQPKFFLKITPKWVPAPEKVNIFVGIVEIMLGLAVLFEPTRPYAAWAIIALLIAVFPANIYHYQKAKAKGKHVWSTLLRLPVQALLIFWAWSFT